MAIFPTIPSLLPISEVAVGHSQSLDQVKQKSGLEAKGISKAVVERPGNSPRIEKKPFAFSLLKCLLSKIKDFDRLSPNGLEVPQRCPTSNVDTEKENIFLKEKPRIYLKIRDFSSSRCIFQDLCLPAWLEARFFIHEAARVLLHFEQLDIENQGL